MTLESILAHSIRGGSLAPTFLCSEDLPWLERLISEFRRYEGKRRHELTTRLKEPFPFHAPPAKQALAVLALQFVLSRSQSRSNAKTPRSMREALFKASAGREQDSRTTVLGEVAARFACTPEELLQSLFDDLASEKRLDTSCLERLAPIDLALDANLLLTKSLLARSLSITISLSGQCRPVIRQAKLKGLICTITREPVQTIATEAAAGTGVEDGTKDMFRLQISGPFSLFRHTLVYGRHLGELLPFLQRCDRYALRAIGRMGNSRFTRHRILEKNRSNGRARLHREVRP